MSATNFAQQTDNEKRAWAMKTWSVGRDQSLFAKFLGEGANNVIQKITELKKSVKGTRAVITLVNDLGAGGIAGDRTLEGNEESMRSEETVIRIDQLRRSVTNEGVISDQRSILDFRKEATDKLGYWQANVTDELVFNTLAGINYSRAPSGESRIGYDAVNLDFAADVTPPTAKRRVRWNGTTGLIEVGGGTNTVTSADTPTWEFIAQLKAYANSTYMRGIRENGEETYHCFLSPEAMLKLKLSNTYMLNLRHAVQRSSDNKLFTGGSVKIDGIYLHETRYCPNTRRASAGNKYGALGAVDGCQILFCGAQALAFADLGTIGWKEKTSDFDNRLSIATGMQFGLRKPQFVSEASGGTLEDFGVISAFVAQ